MDEFIKEDSFEFGDDVYNEYNDFDTLNDKNSFNSPFLGFVETNQYQNGVENSESDNDFEPQNFEEEGFDYKESNVEENQNLEENEEKSITESFETYDDFENNIKEESNFDFEPQNFEKEMFDYKESNVGESQILEESEEESITESFETYDDFENNIKEESNFNFKITNIDGVEFGSQELNAEENQNLEKNEEESITESFESNNDFENNIKEESNFNFESQNNKKIDNEFLEQKPETFVESIEDNFEYDVVEPTTEPNIIQKKDVQTSIISDTSIDELNKLTDYKEEKINVTDIKSLFNKVGNNVQEASEIFMKNSEMKEKIDAKFEQLKQIQSTIENAKKAQYDEINSYKEEVFKKLTEKKSEIEERINKLKEFQLNLEKEKEAFEKYKIEQTAEIENVQREVQEAYDARREELNHIEDVLRKQKDALDEERTQLSLDKIQYESDKNELANNLLKFNQIVDSFTVGVENAGKGE